MQKLLVYQPEFDAAFCRWGLMFLPDLRNGLLNIYGSLVNGGYLAAVWASPDKVPFLSVSMNTVVKETESDASSAFWTI